MIGRAAEGASALVGVGVVGTIIFFRRQWPLLAIEFGACPKSVTEACRYDLSYITPMVPVQ
jgi:hypothetical protein